VQARSPQEHVACQPMCGVPASRAAQQRHAPRLPQTWRPRACRPASHLNLTLTHTQGGRPGDDSHTYSCAPDEQAHRPAARASRAARCGRARPPAPPARPAAAAPASGPAPRARFSVSGRCPKLRPYPKLSRQSLWPAVHRGAGAGRAALRSAWCFTCSIMPDITCMRRHRASPSTFFFKADKWHSRSHGEAL